MTFVNPESSNPGVGDFYTVPFNHMDICKPSSRKSILFRLDCCDQMLQYHFILFSSAGSSTICYGTQWTKQRRTLRRIRSSGKISSHQDFIQHVQFYNVHTHYSMSTLSNFSCKTFVQCCSVSTKIGFSPCYPKIPDITPRLSKVADAVIKPLLLVKKYYVCMKRFTQ